MGKCLAHRRLSRRPLKSLPTATEYRRIHITQGDERRKRSREALLWRRRTESYVADASGNFVGRYNLPDGTLIYVYGSTLAQVRWEKAAGTRYWQKVQYIAPT